MTQPWQNRIVRYSDEIPENLLANPDNYRTHPGHQAEALRGVLGDVGIVQNVLANVQTGHLIDGHLRVMEAMRSGQPTIPVTWVDLSLDEERLILATLDPLSALAGTDAGKFEDLLREVSTDSPAVQAMLDSLAVSAGIVPGLDAPGAGGDEFDTTPAEGPTRTAVGDLWLLGKHRLLVGDCTDPVNVARLMDGKRAALCASDPPYNVQIDYGDQVDDNKSDGEYEQFSRVWLALAQQHSQRQIISPGGQNLTKWARWFESFHIACWTKPFSTTNGKVAHLWSWEPLFFFGVQWPRKRANDIFEYGIQYDPKLGKSHPCPKPISLWIDLVENYTEPGELLYEPFLGSGTTLIAAQRTGRTCYGLEIAPQYADVILRRWEAETGQQAQNAGAT